MAAVRKAEKQSAAAEVEAEVRLAAAGRAEVVPCVLLVALATQPSERPVAPAKTNRFALGMGMGRRCKVRRGEEMPRAKQGRGQRQSKSKGMLLWP